MNWVLYTVLFCIGFLNVPRSLVHDCDAHASHSDSHVSSHHDSSDDSDLHFYQDDCHSCEFQLDYFEVPSFNIDHQSKANYFVHVPKNNGQVQIALNLTYNLRGPPVFGLLS